MRHLRLLLGLLLLSLLALAKDKPDLEETPFDEPPANIVYFEDSDTLLALVRNARTAYRSEDGGANWKPLENSKGHAVEMMKHPYDKHTAVVIGDDKEHWVTYDRGDKWQEFKSERGPSHMRPAIEFHAEDSKRMLFHADSCIGLICDPSVYYTTDGFESDPILLSENVISCIWAKSTDIFTSGDADVDKNEVLCIAKGKFLRSKSRLVTTMDFFKSDATEPTMSDGRTVDGVTNVAAVKKYIVFAAKSSSSDELAMYVSDDTKIWHRAEFGEHKLEEDAYTLLESTNYSMQVDVMTGNPRSAMGVFLTSNSNGTFFTKNMEHTNRNLRGFVDFEKVTSIQGVVLVNTVDNWEDVERNILSEKEIVSQISFDDGRTWEQLKVDGDRLHLHSVTKQRNVGRIFTSPAVGLVMGVGNTGKALGPYEGGDTYVSKDAGLTWERALRKPHVYEFGAQGSILVAIEDGETDVISWSMDYGKNWDKMDLEEKIKPLALLTTPDSTSLHFLVIAAKGSGGDMKFSTLALDFNGLHEKECEDDDFESWPGRVDEKGDPTCIMGHVQYFKRRKADAKCLVVSKHFEDPEEKREKCKCTKKDFECDYNFKRDEDGTCVPYGPVKAPDGACEDGQKTFKGSSGYRLIPGDDCSGGENLAEEVERECTDTRKPPVSGEIANEVTEFEGSRFLEYYYLEQGENASGDDETVVMRTDRNVWVTHDHGKRWGKVLADEDIIAIYPHQYNSDRVYMITPSEKVIYSTDRLKTLHSFNTPDAPNHQEQVLTFHPGQKDWLIWTGSRGCKAGGRDCLTVAHKSTNHGEDWSTLLKGVRKCLFVYSENRAETNKLVYCEQYEDENPGNSLLLYSSDDWFEDKNVLKRDVINFATMAEYIVVAIRDDDQETLKVDTSVDGKTFADANFPPNFRVTHQQAYTVLDSSTHAIFLHVTVNGNEGSAYGSIIKSNSNGTFYVLSISEVNRNDMGYVDFEKMQGIEGVAIINRVANAREVDSGATKKLKTYITHNDGADWALLRPHSDHTYSCSGDAEKCSLHLHGYTERKDPRDTYSSPSAVGLMMATGNVGEFLGHKEDADTFITGDGGVTWFFAAEGNWMWEYGDRGSIIVIVKEDEPTDFVRYTLDEGKTWEEHVFGQKMVVSDITTVTSDTSRNFLLWGKIGSKIATVSIDFSGLKERSVRCKLDEANPTADDYFLWSPRHPLSDDDCLFGHIAEYHRKRPEKQCYNGRMSEDLHNIAKNCSCTREDFECDYNYERQPDGQCRLVDGLEKADPKDVCAQNKHLTEYYEITGYRRIPLTTCQGGRELDYTSRVHACPGKEEEFKKKHAISGAGLFFAIVIPIATAAGIGYWVWKNWDGKFGRIRLGDGMGIGGGQGAAGGESPLVKYPVMAISGLVAIIAAIPMVVGSVWRMISTRIARGGGGGGQTRPYTSRSSLQRGRGDYAIVEPDEGELLGDDSDEDV